MNRILIPLALVVLVAGCAMPSLFGQQTEQPVLADTAQTVVVREIYHETPVVYLDTVYMAADPEPVQPVYVTEEYNEYNEYNHTDVYVHEHVVVHPPPPPKDREHGWSPREHERPRGGRRDGGSTWDRNQPRDQEKPKPINPRHPVKRMDVPVTNDRQSVPVPPIPSTPPCQPVRPKRQVPAGSAEVTPVQHEAPKQVLAPTVDKPATPPSDQVQVSLAKPARK